MLKSPGTDIFSQFGGRRFWHSITIHIVVCTWICFLENYSLRPPTLGGHGKSYSRLVRVQCAATGRFSVFLAGSLPYIYNSNAYWPLFTAVFSCLQFWLWPSRMKSDKIAKIRKSRKKLQFYWKCTFMIFLPVKSWFSRYFLIKSNIYKNLLKSRLEIFLHNFD